MQLLFLAFFNWFSDLIISVVFKSKVFTIRCSVVYDIKIIVAFVFFQRHHRKLVFYLVKLLHEAVQQRALKKPQSLAR